jgi:O-antigen/teichoic acid export membrane protein
VLRSIFGISLREGRTVDRKDSQDTKGFFDREELKRDLRRKVVRSALSKLSANGIVTVLTMGSTIVLARLLTPAEFGLLAMVTAITEFVRSFREIGLGSATVQREKISHEEISTLFWINLSAGVAIAGLLVCFSPVIGWFYCDTRLVSLTIALSSIFILGGLTVQHRALLERQMRFGALGAINVISTIGSIGFAILLAIYGFGVWSLVLRDVVFALFYGGGTWIACRWIPGRPRGSGQVRASLRFGVDVSGFEIIQNFTRSVDQVIIGRFFGAVQLGLYTKGFQLAMMPIDQIRMIFWDIGFSPLSSLHNDRERFKRFYSRLLSVMSFIYMPLVVFIAIQSQDIVRLVLGEKWLEAAPLLRIFAIVSLVRPILGTFQLVMTSCGNTRRCVLWGMVNSIGMILAFGIGIKWGTPGVAYGYASASWAAVIWSFWYCFRNTPVSASLVLKAISLPLIASFGGGGILAALLPLMSSMNVINSTILGGAVITIAYLGIWLCIPGGRQRALEMWSYRREAFSGK